ncbi:D-inositol-3-phosphate glycosyltransferase [anaerobic digester metagenome]
MKIVHVIDYFQPKLGYQEPNLAIEQLGMGHSVVVVTSDRYSPSLYEGDAVKQVLGERIRKPGHYIEEGIPTVRLNVLFEHFPAIWVSGLEKQILNLQPDLVHVHGVATFSAMRVAGLKKKINFKLIIDDHMTFGASRSPLRCLYPVFKHTFAKKILKHSDLLVGVSNTSKQFMHEKYGFPLEQIELIPLGAGIKRFHFDPQARQLIREKFALNDDAIVFIYAGKVVPVKGPHILIDAAIELAKQHPNVFVIVVGNGPDGYIQEMMDKIKKHSLENHFIFNKAVPNDQLYQYYSAADVAVWPREASLSMMEAMSCNLPIIISAESEVSERLEYNNGLQYWHEDAENLKLQMEKMLDESLRLEMGANGRKLVEDKLNWTKISQRFLDDVSN